MAQYRMERSVDDVNVSCHKLQLWALPNFNFRIIFTLWNYNYRGHPVWLKYITGGPCIVPFYVPEKYGLMQNSTMQDRLNRAILNGTMQGIYSIQNGTMQEFWPICKWYYCETVLLWTPCIYLPT